MLLSVAGKEMSFIIPLGEAFDLAVDLTAKGYKEKASQIVLV